MSEPLQTAIVSRKWPPAMGGMETCSEMRRRHLRSHGDMELISLPGDGEGRTPRPWELLWLGMKTSFSLIFARRLAPVVHVANMARWPLAFAARWIEQITEIVGWQTAETAVRKTSAQYRSQLSQLDPRGARHCTPLHQCTS